MYVVEYHWHAVARGFSQADISGNHAFKDLGSEETAEVCGYLLRKRRPVVVHREKNSFDRKLRVDRPAEAHERVEKLGDTFERQVLALDRDEDGIARCESVEGQEIE